MPFDNPAQASQDHMINRASLERLEYMQKHPQEYFLTKVSLQLIEERIEELMEEEKEKKKEAEDF